jgi:hypothetical protein
MKKLWKWLFGTRNKQCNIHDVSVAVCPYCKGTGKQFPWEFGMFIECICQRQTER